MKKNIALIITIIIAQLSHAQAYDSIAVKYAKTITQKELSEHLHVLASDEYEGRETGKKGQKMAMNYLICLLYTSPSPRDLSTSRMPSSA